MLLFLKVNPIQAYKALWEGAFGTSNAFAETLVKATPLLLVGLGICISFRGDVINIGGEGQMIVGALFATWVGLTFTNLPGWLVITLAMLAGFVGGAIWGGIPGVLKAYFRVNEILSTVMMNAIAVQLMNFLLRGALIDPAQAQRASKIPQTARLLEAFHLPRLIPTRLHLGALIAVILAILVYILLWRTTLGYRIRAVGQNPHASRYAGIKVQRYVVLALLLSGAFRGPGRGNAGLWCELPHDHRWFRFWFHGRCRIQWNCGCVIWAAASDLVHPCFHSLWRTFSWSQ